jgi:dienelactone hydrolase
VSEDNTEQKHADETACSGSLLPQQSMTPRTDLREMVRLHIVRRALDCMEAAGERREQATASPQSVAQYRAKVRDAIRGFYGEFPAGPDAEPPDSRPVSEFEHNDFRLENVLFETYPGWEINATVYVPTDYRPPFPAVIVPVGHSGKQFENYQLPCQYFARAGYLAICFDPPGQRSEKQPGNDHFNDGVRDYLIGHTSSRYFISDAIRCIDYATTRDDVDVSGGVAMTGVSGGGKTTAFASVLDDRIKVIGPCCCLASLCDIDITQCYAGCPETHQFGRYAEGIDDVDLLCAAVPTPCLVMAGEGDEVYHIHDTRRLADMVARFYEAAGVPEKFELSVDPGGHAYPLAQAEAFMRFTNRWLLEEPDRPVPEPSDGDFEMRPYEELRCRPRTDVNMRTLATDEADALAECGDHTPGAVQGAARKIARVDGEVELPDAEVGEPFQVWCHDWRSVMLRPEPGIELPATLLTTRGDEPAATILHLDDAGRHRMLYRGGALTGAIRFLDRDRPVFNLLTVDLRGWGDTAPGMYPYEMAGWGSVERYAAYATAALGDPLISMRIRDALGTLQWLRSWPKVDSRRIILTGSGAGSIVALHVGAIDGDLAGVITLEGLSSFRNLIATEAYPWPADIFLPGALRHYDLPELAASIPAPVHAHNLRDGAGEAAGEMELEKWRDSEKTTVSGPDGGFSLAATVESMAGASQQGGNRDGTTISD